MDNLLVSIIVPVYNVENYLCKCLDSIINQTYQNIEIILVDDGSKDNSGQICDEYSSKDSRIRVIHKENQGVALARMIGFENSKGELITFIDSDDYVDLEYVEKLVSPFEQYDIDLCTCENVFVKQDAIHCYPRTVHGLLNRRDIDDMLSTNYLMDPTIGNAGLPIYLCAKMIRRRYVRDALEQGKGLSWGEDQVAVFHILLNVRSMYALSYKLYNYVLHEGQVSKKFDAGIWNNQFETWRRYILLDNRCLLKQQLSQRMWWTIKRNFRRMRSLSCLEFCHEMRLIENNKMWRELLKEGNLTQGKRERFAFFLLRYKLYSFFYFFLLERL